jgi:hypothetical protein
MLNPGAKRTAGLSTMSILEKEFHLVSNNLDPGYRKAVDNPLNGEILISMKFGLESNRAVKRRSKIIVKRLIIL